MSLRLQDKENVSKEFRVLFIGAGNVMFGSSEGPWNHSARLEQKLGARLKIVALVDPDIKRCEETLRRKTATEAASAYLNTRIFHTLQELFDDKSFDKDLHAIIIGVPPYFRGTLWPGRNTEIEVIRHFPKVPLLIEKPVAVPGSVEVLEVFNIGRAIRESGAICGVAYMLRYLKAVQMMKKIIEENHLTIMVTTARFACAYASIGKPDYWFKSRFGGPIVEQATHVCDLSRYFGGEVDQSTISANTVEYDEAPGKLSKIDEKCLEDQVTPDDKISRATVANWKYEGGALGSLVHVVALHGDEYACDFEVIADGYMMRLVNPYVEPVLYVRRPGSTHEERHTFPGDDPYLSEISAFVDAVDDPTSSTSRILSTFEDACLTFRFTWDIRCAAERAAASRKYKQKTV